MVPIICNPISWSDWQRLPDKVARFHPSFSLIWMQTDSLRHLCICSLYSHKEKLGYSCLSESLISVKEYTMFDKDEALFHLNIANAEVLLVNERLQCNLNQEFLQAKIVVLPSNCFAVQNITKALVALEQQDWLHVIRNSILQAVDPQQEEVMKSLAGLFWYLKQNQWLDQIRMATINRNSQLINISRATYEYLQIMKEEIHPSFVRGNGKNKQGFTVFNLYNSLTATAEGSRTMLQRFMSPTFQKPVLQDRYNTLEFIHNNLMHKEQAISKCLRRIFNLRSIIKRFQEVKVQIQDWRRLRTSLTHIVKLRAEIYEAEEMPLSIKNLLTTPHMQSVRFLLQLIDSVLNLQPFEIKSNINQHLDTFREDYSNITSNLQRFTQEHSTVWGINGKIVFIPQVGYLVNTLMDVTEPSWTYQFSNQSGHFYTHEMTEQLDKQYGDKYAQIQDVQKEIMVELEDVVKRHSNSLREVYKMVGEFDCSLAMAKVGKNFTRPKLGTERLIVKNGWHILTGGKSVGNNCFSYLFEEWQKLRMYNSELNLVNSNYSNRCLLVSGANASGKTLYAKQTGIIVFLAHIGSFVPAEFATIPLLDSIASFNVAASLFLNHHGAKEQLTALNRILGNLTRRSFLVVDQFGHSCSYLDSERVVYALIQYLTTHEFPDCSHPKYPLCASTSKLPLSIIITHMKDLFNRDLGYSPHLRQMQTLVNTGESDIQYLYKLSPGWYCGTHALVVCEKMKLDGWFVGGIKDLCEEFRGFKLGMRQKTSKMQDTQKRIRDYLMAEDSN